MRILAFAVLFLSGMGLVAYSYVGGYVELAAKMGAADDLDGVAEPFLAFMALVMSGEAPSQLAVPLSFGALLMAAGIFMLFAGGKSRND